MLNTIDESIRRRTLRIGHCASLRIREFGVGLDVNISRQVLDCE